MTYAIDLITGKGFALCITSECEQASSTLSSADQMESLRYVILRGANNALHVNSGSTKINFQRMERHLTDFRFDAVLASMLLEKCVNISSTRMTSPLVCENKGTPARSAKRTYRDAMLSIMTTRAALELIPAERAFEAFSATSAILALERSAIRLMQCLRQSTTLRSTCNALKYIWRADLKTDAIEDLKKARWYIERELQKRGT